MKDAAEAFLEYLDKNHAVLSSNIEERGNVIEGLICAVTKDGVRDDAFREHFETVQHKAIEALTLKEVYTYLTHLVIRDRCWGTLETSIEDGTLRLLLKRYLELAQ